MSTVASPNMSLPVPVVGDEAGPEYAIDINSCMSILDAHDHSPGLGVQITPSGLNINADLSIGSNNLTGIRSSRFSVQSAALALASDLNCTYVTGVDLYYNDGNGNQIQITDNGGVAGTPGSIANLTSPASASYVALSETFVWQSDANEAATMDMRSAILRNSTASSFGLTLSAPTLAGDATQTLPQVPGATSFMTMAASGAMAATIPIALGLTNSMMADDNIALRNMQDDSVGTDEIIDLSVTNAKLAALPYTNSTSSGNFTTNSTSNVVVTNLSLNFTATGRPVFIGLYGDNTSPATFQLDSVTNIATANVFFFRDATGIQGNMIGSTLVGSSMYFPANLTFIDIPSAGTYTYTVKVNVNAVTTTLHVSNLRLVMYEL